MPAGDASRFGLSPFDVTCYDAAAVCKDVGYDHDARVGKRRIAFGRRGPVGALDHQRRAHPRRALGVKHVLHGGGDEAVDFESEKFLVRYRLALGTFEVPSPGMIVHERFDIEAARVIHAAAALAQRHHLCAPRRKEMRGPGADVSETLNRDSRILYGFLKQRLHRDARGVGDAAPGGLEASRKPANPRRLARHGFRNVRLAVYRGHVERVGAEVRRGDVCAVRQFAFVYVHEFVKEVYPFEGRYRRRVDGDAALAAAEGQFHQRRFPRHALGEIHGFIEGNVGRKPDAALGRAARRVVIDHEALRGKESFTGNADVQIDNRLLLALLQKHPRAVGHLGVSGNAFQVYRTHLNSPALTRAP